MLVAPHLLLLQTTTWVPVGHWALDVELVARHEASLLPTANDQALWAQWSAIILFIPKPPKMARCRAVSLIPPKAEEEDNAEVGKSRIETSSDEQEASNGEDRQEHLHMQDTLTSVNQLFGEHEDTDPESNSGEKVRTAREKQHKDSPKEDSPKKDSSGSSSEEELPTDEALRDGARQKAQLLDTCFDAWHHDKIANNVVGWATWDTMICNLPEHSKAQPNHPNPVGPPLDYMAECKVFDCIRSDLYDLCHFYALGTTGDPPDFPVPWEPVTHRQVRDLLKLAQSIGRSYVILAHSTDSVTAMSMLRELHMATCLRHLQVDLCDKFIKMSFCPFCAYTGANDLSYLNHIIIVHYNTSYGCRKCLKQAFMPSSALHNHKKVCLGFDKKSAAGSDSKPSSGGGGNGSQGSSSTRATPKKKDSKAPTANSQGSSIPTALQTTPSCSRCDKSHCSKPHKDSKSKKGSLGNKKKKRGM